MDLEAPLVLAAALADCLTCRSLPPIAECELPCSQGLCDGALQVNQTAQADRQLLASQLQVSIGGA